MDNQKINIVRITLSGRMEREDTVVRELPLTIYLNGREMITTLCSPAEPEALAVGWLYAEGLLRGSGDINEILVDMERGTVRVAAGGVAEPARAGPAVVKSEMTVKPRQVLGLAYKFQHYSPAFLETGGVHGAALCDTARILLFTEDIGRHNAIDKLFGRCILEDEPATDRILITSGRISSEIMEKIARWPLPVVVSLSAPTGAAVTLAADLGITLIGFVRGQRMNVYTHDWRVR